MTTITITLTTDASDDQTWGSALDAIEYATPVAQNLSVHSAWSGDVDTMHSGFRVQVAVTHGQPVIDAGDTLDTLDTLVEALDQVRDSYTRLRLQESILADAMKVGDDAQANFSAERVDMHRTNLATAQARLEAAQSAHAASTRVR